MTAAMAKLQRRDTRSHSHSLMETNNKRPKRELKAPAWLVQRYSASGDQFYRSDLCNGSWESQSSLALRNEDISLNQDGAFSRDSESWETLPNLLSRLSSASIKKGVNCSRKRKVRAETESPTLDDFERSEFQAIKVTERSWDCYSEDTADTCPSGQFLPGSSNRFRQYCAHNPYAAQAAAASLLAGAAWIEALHALAQAKVYARISAAKRSSGERQ